MPITGPSSYPPVVREFIEHWEEAHGVFGADLPVLPGGLTRTTLETKETELETARNAVSDARTDRALARATLTGLLTELQAAVVAFNAKVRSSLPDSAVAKSLAESFTVGQGEGIVREALRRTSRLWLTVDQILPVPPGLTLPLILPSGVDRVAFDGKREDLRLAYRALSAAEVDLTLAREERNDVQDAIYPILKAYRAKITGDLNAGHALIDSLPALTPPEGHTPAAVTLAGSWNAGTAKADLSWSESTDADLAEYEVRGVAGDDYEEEDEVLVASIAAGQPRTLSTDFALSAPGLSASFKVFVVLDSGREKGSTAVTVTRP